MKYQKYKIELMLTNVDRESFERTIAALDDAILTADMPNAGNLIDVKYVMLNIYSQIGRPPMGRVL